MLDLGAAACERPRVRAAARSRRSWAESAPRSRRTTVDPLQPGAARRPGVVRARPSRRHRADQRSPRHYVARGPPARARGPSWSRSRATTSSSSTSSSEAWDAHRDGPRRPLSGRARRGTMQLPCLAHRCTRPAGPVQRARGRRRSTSSSGSRSRATSRATSSPGCWSTAPSTAAGRSTGSGSCTTAPARWCCGGGSSASRARRTPLGLSRRSGLSDGRDGDVLERGADLVGEHALVDGQRAAQLRGGAGSDDRRA